MDIKAKFDKLLDDTPFPIPLSYYGKLQSLTGAVYEIGKDENMDDELKELSKFIQRLVVLKEFEDNISNLLPKRMDFHHMFDTGIDHRHQNLNEVTVNFPQEINFPEQNYQISETLIKSVVEKFKTEMQYDFNTTKIIAWVKSKIVE